MNVRFEVGAMLAGLLTVVGCGANGAQVTGRVTCNDKPVSGSILFSPLGENAGNTGPAVNATLDEEGRFQLRLKTIGKHSVVVTPADVKFPVPPGQWDYPCDRSAVEREVQTGTNDFTIEMAPRK